MAANITDTIRVIAQQEMPTIARGHVLSLDPLRVQLTDDPAVRLSDQSLIISSEKLPLEIGAEYYFLSVNRGKIYYLMDRV